MRFILFYSHSDGDLFMCEDNMLFSHVRISCCPFAVFCFNCGSSATIVMLLSFQGNFLLNNHCKPCDRCHKGEIVVEECLPKRNTLCRKLPKSTCPPSSPHITSNSQEPVTGTKPVERGTVHAM